MGKHVEIETAVDPSKEIIVRMKKPCQAASISNWQAFTEFFQRYSEDLLSPLSIDGDTAFHIAASRENSTLLRDLLGMVESCKIIEVLTGLTDKYGNTVLHEVATTDCVDAAKLAVNRLRSSCDGTREMEENNQCHLGNLLKVRNKLGETPLYRAAALGSQKMVEYLAKEIEKVSGNINDHFYRHDRVSILHIAILAQRFETALWLLKKDKELGQVKETNGLTCLHLLALMPSAFRSTSRMSRLKNIVYCYLPGFLDDDDDDSDISDTYKHSRGLRRSKCWTGWPIMKDICMKKQKHGLALKLVKLLAKQDISWNIATYIPQDTTISIELGGGSETEDDSQANTLSDVSSSSPETPLFMAARTGIIEIAEEILNEYPEAVEHVSENEQNILHVVLMHRQEKIFKLIKKVVISMDSLASGIDRNGNTILHLVADMTYYHGTRAGPAFQLQDELEWFERVKKEMPSHYVIHRNKNKRTAEELFTQQHSKQLEEAKKWIKDVSQSCSAVAVLVASVAFAAAYTVPGGNNKNGLPILLNSSLFTLFAIMDVASLASSFTSVVMFLSVLTSPFEQKAFLYTLPKKMTLGFTFLFLSVITTMVTFTATLLLILGSLNRNWTAAFIYSAAFIPVFVFALMHFRLYVDFIDAINDYLEGAIEDLSRNKTKKKRN